MLLLCISVTLIFIPVRAVADLIDHDGDFGDEQRGEDGREHPERKLHGRGGYR